MTQVIKGLPTPQQHDVHIAVPSQGLKSCQNQAPPWPLPGEKDDACNNKPSAAVCSAGIQPLITVFPSSTEARPKCPTEKFSQSGLEHLLPISLWPPIPRAVTPVPQAVTPTAASRSPCHHSRHRKEDTKIEGNHRYLHQKTEVIPSDPTGYGKSILILLQNTLFVPSCFYPFSQCSPSNMTTRPSSRSPSSLLSATKASSART